MSFTEDHCACGCPWEGYETIEAADTWRHDHWKEALDDPDHDDHKEALESLHEYMKDRWMEDLDIFFNELKSGVETPESPPSTLKEMVDTLEADDRIDFWHCEDCSDNISGNRCYRNRFPIRKAPSWPQPRAAKALDA